MLERNVDFVTIVIVVTFVSVIFDTCLTSSLSDADKGLTDIGLPARKRRSLMAQHSNNENYIVMNDLVTKSNFIITAQAGQPITISSHNLGYSSSSIQPENIVYLVTKDLALGQGQLLLIDQPQKQVQKFTQADVDAQKLAYIPPRAEAVPTELLLSIELAVIRSPDNTVLMNRQPFMIHLQPPHQSSPLFKIINPTINVQKANSTTIQKQYFEINGTDNDNPDLRLVITEMPQSGTLFLQCKNKPSIDLSGGVEFTLLELKDCIIQYKHNNNYAHLRDTFEVLATVGHFELTNQINLNIISQSENSSPLSERKGIVSKRIDYMIQFGVNENAITVKENCGSFRIPVQRWGDLSTESQVQCFTTQQTGTAGTDFIERPRNSEQSLLIFAPGVTIVDCEVMVNDDKVYENEESLEVKLGNLYGTPGAVLGEKTSITVKIADPEDKPKLQFDRDEISVSEPVMMRPDATSTITVNVVRSGDVSQEARVRVSTCDNSALAGIDYEPTSQLLVFSPGTETLPVHVRVIHRPTRIQTQTFSLTLSPKEVTGAELGEITSITIKVNRGVSGEAMKVLPSQPAVVSLLEYDSKMTQHQDSNPSPGYPLVCLSSCDTRHPNFNATKVLCNSAGIDDTNIAYSWEIAMPSLNGRTHSAFRLIRDSTIYGNSHIKVLDPLFFARKFKVRCVTTPFTKSANGQKAMGVALRSKHVTIGSEQEAICPSSSYARNEGDYFREHSFVAMLTYVDSSNAQDLKHKNTIHVHIEIPHTDGMVPLISTLPLSNPRLLLLDKRHTAQHICSNLHNNSAFLVSEILGPPVQDIGFSRPYQFSTILRGNNTVQLYQHLNLNTCTWKFDAWFHMSQLVDNCSGKVTSEFQVGDHGESYVTVQVPLYVTYVSASAPFGWTAVEHRTELEISFYYTSLLWQGGFKTQHQYEADIQVRRITADEDGRMVIDLGTVAKFRGHFVTSHPSKPGTKSKVVPPSGVNANFTLDLAWSQATWDGPEQTWRITSTYSLQDYSGEYTLKLIPCTVRSTQKYQSKARSRHRTTDCTPHEPAEFKIPVIFRQSSRPTPLVYNLNTRFTLTNDKETFLVRPTEPEHLKDYTGVFSPGEQVYGRVLWQATQHLHSAYSLTIQRLYLCAGVDGYVPLYDPSGYLHDAGPQYGCLQTSPKIKHSFLLLDRENPYSVDKYYNDVSLEVYFATDLPEYEQLDSYPGVDGFILKVDPLYKINSGYTWYLQVLYTIGAASFGRDKRSITNPDDLRNGTDMKSLRLEVTGSMDLSMEVSPEVVKEDGQNPVLLRTLLGGVSVIIAAIVAIWAKMSWRSGEGKVSQRIAKKRRKIPLNSEVNARYKSVKVHSVPAVTVWNDIRAISTEV